VLLGWIGLLLRVLAIATALAVACRPGVATAMTTPAKPSHKETLSRNRLQPVAWSVVHGG
jgi:hypothetical protein